MALGPSRHAAAAAAHTSGNGREPAWIATQAGRGSVDGNGLGLFSRRFLPSRTRAVAKGCRTVRALMACHPALQGR